MGVLAALNPLAAVGGLISSVIEQHRINEWIKLLISLTFSGVVSFLFTCGSTIGTLAASKVPAVFCLLGGLAAGMVMAAVMMTVTWRRSPLTKGLIVALPAEEATQEMSVNQQVISK